MTSSAPSQAHHPMAQPLGTAGPSQLVVSTKANFSKLPRSVTWRLLLGLIKSPRQNTTVLELEDVIQFNNQLLQEEVSNYARLKELYTPHLSEMDAPSAPAVISTSNGDPIETPEADKPLPIAPDSSSDFFDPLTAMMMEQQAQEVRRQELDLAYRKEKARRNRGLSDPGSKVVEDYVDADGEKKLDREALSIIDKDLHRLPKPSVTEVVEGGVSITTTWDTPEQQQSWMDALREMLYIFSQENPHIGYRQGMHEVASYLWLVLVIDRQRQMLFSGPGDQSELLALVFDRPAAYTMLQSILGHVRQAFDVKVASNSRPLEDMSHSTLSKIQQYYQNQGHPDRLCPLLKSLSVPPQLYCTKWIRLLYSREVVGASNVIILWDVFVELVSEGWEWMALLETTAASRILMCQEELLKPDVSPEAHHHRVMDSLMNMPPLNDLEPLVKQLNQLLDMQKYQQTHPELGTMGIVDHTAAGQTQQQLHMHQHPHPQHRYQQQLHHYQQPPQGNQALGKNGGDLFNLQAVKQSLEQGVERLSSSSDTWRKKLEEGWNGLQPQPLPGQQPQEQEHYSDNNVRMIDAAMFGDDSIGEHKVRQTPLNPQPPQYGLSPQQQIAQQPRPMQPQQPHHLHQQGYSTASTSSSFGAVQGTGMNGPNSTPMSALIPPHRQQPTQQQAIANNSNPIQLQQQQQENQLLAFRLGNSCAILQDFVMSVARTPDQQQQFQAVNSFQNGGTNSTKTKVPNAVWEALAEVEAVRGILLQR
ncbi:TBC1 domain family member 5 [Seminavis robusta]|uniref:TBC1 domain family member 5 n=1 Tax=Seminavis robusta TaxID=568900 RepID=A0A9N8EX59_9STRA|nr:TBC1 domain family member 5 [Seminavis robusta]|eukprot:Sro1959_g307990.1 TBC1 domain family member 5 (758) ;mRNA; f:16799-19393